MPTKLTKPRSLMAHESNWIDRLTMGVFRPRQKRLDPRTLPDHLKRDMGFLDGRGPQNRGC